MYGSRVALEKFSTQTFAVETELALDRALKVRFTDASWNEVRRLIASGKVFVRGERTLDGRQLVAPGTELSIRMTAPRTRPGFEVKDDLVLYHDHDVVVVNKPEGLSSITHEGEPDSTDRLVQRWLTQTDRRSAGPLHIVHRLDKVTSGVMIFARNRHGMLLLKEQFRAHSVGRFYLAIANGAPLAGRIEGRIVRDRGDGIRGLTKEWNRGVHSVTDVEVLEQLRGCALIRCRLETGRTHQIRIHLASRGAPLVGEPLYIKGLSGSFLEAPRVMLHAAFLSFEHPTKRTQMRFEVPIPRAFEDFATAHRAR